MNQAIKAIVASVTGLLIVGCAGSKKDQMSSVTDVSPNTPVTASASTPTSGGFSAAQPVIYDSAPASGSNTTSATPSASSLSSAGGSYTVKKGDTLYAIAKTHYGDGKSWQKIASANPGLKPSTLKVGQTITLP